MPANDIAEELGNVRMANVVLLGAYFAATGTMPLETVETALDLHLGERQRKYLASNKEALRRGAGDVSESASAATQDNALSVSAFGLAVDSTPSSTRRLSHGDTVEEPLRPAQPAHGPFDHSRAAEVHAAARHHLVCRRPAGPRAVPEGRGAGSRLPGASASYGEKALQYGPTEGLMPLRRWISERMVRYGIQAEADNVFITTGSQQALDLIGKLLINPGDQVLVEEPTYLGALQAWNAYQAEYVGVPIDDHGLRTELLEGALRVGPKFMYILPNFQNPGGTTLSLDRRLELVRLANKYGIPIVEDDPYGALRFEGEHLPPLVALDADFQAGSGLNGHGFMEGNVIYLGTFSKTLAPGPAPRLGGGAGRGDRPARHGQAGNRPANLHVRSDAGLGDAQRWLPGRPHQGDPQGVRRAPRCDAGCAGALLPRGVLVDAPRGRAVPVGARAGMDRHRASCCRRRCRRRWPSCPASPSTPTRSAAATRCV